MQLKRGAVLLAALDMNQDKVVIFLAKLYTSFTILGLLISRIVWIGRYPFPSDHEPEELPCLNTKGPVDGIQAHVVLSKLLKCFL